MNKPLEVWKLLWPNGVPQEQYETAMHVAFLSRAVPEETPKAGGLQESYR